jgi:gluconokinase
MIVVVMGVSGAGKTTIGKLLAGRLGFVFLEGDDWHPEQNVAKMAAGTPLTDEDRRPWLARLNALLREREARGESVVLACSALKEAYRESLSRGLDDWRLVYLEGGCELIRSRLEGRRHRYMPASLLESQFAALEPPAHAIKADVTEPPESCVSAIVAALAASARAADRAGR